jgi:AcrR family transcriptional regulator
MARPKTRSDEEVLAATARVLGRLGPHDFTLADAAREAGLAPATLLQRFGSKHGLLVAFARWASRRADAPFERAAREGGSALVQLRRALLLMAGPAGNRRRFANHLALLLEDVRDPALRRAAASHARRTEANIARLLRSAMRQGEIGLAHPERWAAVVHAAWNGALIQWGLRGQGPLEAALERLLRTLLGSVASSRRPARERRSATMHRRPGGAPASAA